MFAEEPTDLTATGSCTIALTVILAGRRLGAGARGGIARTTV